MDFTFDVQEQLKSKEFQAISLWIATDFVSEIPALGILSIQETA